MELDIAPYRAELLAGLDSLWSEVFPDDSVWNQARVAASAKLAVQPDLFLVAMNADRVIGSIMAGYDGHRGWLYRAAVRRSHQRAGVGTRLVREAERRLQRLGCPKVNLQVIAANADTVGFYEALGYRVEDRISMGRRI
jgi:ribosomal protein S18 acetylase RimI-like enzyme